MMWGCGAGWWVIGAVFMVACITMMGRMMAGMMGHANSGGQGWRDDPERTLADRLARGEIDIEKYNRLLETLRGTHSSAPK
jgi:uncharacterized membrane protein